MNLTKENVRRFDGNINKDDFYNIYTIKQQMK